ncbi:unnamed protein product [Adineta steineri]|uniref:Uncharacterized protein n=2 Tax=Adineta steineri TaxID=433720 RepID=A0A818VN63_9BILA|nr:unnamed protein product [Adineta steineri]CAF3712449.1 unnamed protein product [Adineta steineri]
MIEQNTTTIINHHTSEITSGSTWPNGIESWHFHDIKPQRELFAEKEKLLIQHLQETFSAKLAQKQKIIEDQQRILIELQLNLQELINRKQKQQQQELSSYLIAHYSNPENMEREEDELNDLIKEVAEENEEYEKQLGVTQGQHKTQQNISSKNIDSFELNEYIAQQQSYEFHDNDFAARAAEVFILQNKSKVKRENESINSQVDKSGYSFTVATIFITQSFNAFSTCTTITTTQDQQSKDDLISSTSNDKQEDNNNIKLSCSTTIQSKLVPATKSNCNSNNIRRTALTQLLQLAGKSLARLLILLLSILVHIGYRPNIQFVIGQPVFIIKPGIHPAFGELYDGPYTIIKQLGPQTFDVVDNYDKVKRVHSSQLKPFIERE